MSIEIKFRGQRVDNKEFVYGDLIHGVGWKKGRFYILPAVENLATLPGCDALDGFNVIPETVGQLTGLKDKNGVDIYEGDIVKWSSKTISGTSRIEFQNGSFRMIDYFDSDYNNITEGWMTRYSEVIGNIHQNPDLI